MQSAFTIKPLTTHHSDQALTLIANEFSAGSPLHRTMGITQNEYRNYLSKDWQSYAFNGPVSSLGAFCNSTHELLGCLITTHFPIHVPRPLDSTDTLPEKHRPIASLLQALEHKYLQHNDTTRRSLLVDLAVVKHSHRGSGIYQKLRKTLQQSAKASGYETVFGELSSSETQHVCVEKMQQKVVAEIRYRDFQYGGKTPFVAIEVPQSIQLVRAAL